MQKIIQFIASRSEHARKVIAGTVLVFAGIMLFFAWSAGVSARLPLLGTAFDNVPTAALSAHETRGKIAETPTAAAVSPMKGLIDAFQGLIKLFRGEYPIQAGTASSSLSQATRSTESSARIDELFNKIGDETRATISTESIGAETTTPAPASTPSAPPDNVPPADELPGL